MTETKEESESFIVTTIVPCPSCGIDVGQPCIWVSGGSKRGQPFADKSSHPLRIEAAKNASIIADRQES